MAGPTVIRSRWLPTLPWVWSALLAAVILGPALFAPGYVLRGDMVFVPDQPWKDAWLALDGSVPRAVPMDAVISALSLLLPGWLIQKTFLLSSLVLGGVGAAKLVGERPWFAQVGVITLFLWNPWVAERLLIGQWAFVAGYAALPWVAIAGRRLQDGLKSWPMLVAGMSAAALCSPSTGLMAALVAAGMVLVRPRLAAIALVVATSVVVNLPWLLPAVTVAAPATDGADGFAGFEARGESPLGLLPSLLSLGGIWKTSVVPDARTNAIVVGLSCALTAVALCGLWLELRTGDRLLVKGLAGAGGAALLMAALPGLPGVAALLDRVAGDVPGLALLRDSHRYLAPFVLLLLPGLAAVLERLGALAARPQREMVGAAVGLVVVAPMVLLPTMAWGISGALEPTSYPAEWHDVRRQLETGATGATVVLPWMGSYRGYAWNDHRAMLDPAPRFFPGEVLIDDRVLLGDRILPSEDPRLADITDALAATDAAARLRMLGVRWVLVEKGMRSGEIPDGKVVHAGPELRLIDLGEPTPVASRSSLAPVFLAGDAIVCGFWLLAGRKWGSGRVCSGPVSRAKRERT
jgi:hypothetical protein